MSVYIIEAEKSGAVKIGFAKDIAKRLLEIQPHCPLRCVVIRTIIGGRSEEGWLHRHFRHRRIRSEWFLFCEEMLTVTPPYLTTKPRCFYAGMKIKAFLEMRQLSVALAARECGLEYEAFRLYAAGKRIPRPEAMAKIADWSGGAVGPDDFYGVA